MIPADSTQLEKSDLQCDAMTDSCTDVDLRRDIPTPEMKPLPNPRLHHRRFPGKCVCSVCVLCPPRSGFPLSAHLIGEPLGTILLQEK